MQQYGSKSPKAIDIEYVETIEILVRKSPVSHLCLEIKRLLQQKIPAATLIEYDIREDYVMWGTLSRLYPEAKIPPQVWFTMKNGVRWHVGGEREVREIFSTTLQEGVPV